MEQVKIEALQSTTTVDGLDQFFEGDHGVDQASVTNDQATVIDAVEHRAHWTLEEAAQKLKLSVPTVRRKLYRKQLSGYKVDGPHGMEWRIIPPDHDQSAASHSGKIITDHDQSRVDKAANNSAHGDQQTENAVINTLMTRIGELEGKLEGAVYRNGYLEAQLEQAHKLLEDRRRMPWWRRAWGWFNGSSVRS